MTEDEKKIIYLLAQKLTGAHPDGTFQHGIFISNVENRMRANNINSLSKYLNFAKENRDESAQLISTLSIHTTSWFRENPHYVILQKILLNRTNKDKPYRVWSCACSTGEEVYSFAVLFEEFKKFHPDFNYSILGTDIDPLSLKVAQRAIYEKKNLTSPLSYYKKHVLLGSAHTENYFTFTKEIRHSCEFKVHDIRDKLKITEPFDLIVCRNLLIYFPADEVDKIAQDLVAHLNVGGHLILGHSETINTAKIGVSLIGHSVYQKKKIELTQKSRTISPAKTPILDAKPAPLVPVKIIKKISPHFKPEVILIGASTGGPQAITAILAHLEAGSPPIVVVQHISSQFAQDFAKNLAAATGFKLGSSIDKTYLENNHIYLAGARYHLGVERLGDKIILRHENLPPVNGHCPSVDFLFTSARNVAKQSIAILLSGMGNDGAAGMELLHNEGAYTIAQSESDCVVYGMPKEAVNKNAVDYVGSGDQIGKFLGEVFRRSL